jgi:hypothetical protein
VSVVTKRSLSLRLILSLGLCTSHIVISRQQHSSSANNFWIYCRKYSVKLCNSFLKVHTALIAAPCNCSQHNQVASHEVLTSLVFLSPDDGHNNARNMWRLIWCNSRNIFLLLLHLLVPLFTYDSIVSFKGYNVWQWISGRFVFWSRGYRKEIPNVPLETLTHFMLNFYTFLTHKMETTTDLFLRIECAVLTICAVILRHNCFDPGLIACSCQVLLHTYIHAHAIVIQGIEINVTTALPLSIS